MNYACNEDQYYWQSWISQRDSHAGDYLVRLYMPLVQYHVQRIATGLPKNIHRDDLKSYGMLGLYDALHKFDPDRDLKFDTYASFRIRGAILDGLRKDDWMPRSLRDKLKKIEAAQERLEQKHMRDVSPAEIANEAGMAREEVYEAVREGFAANILSIDESPPDDESGTEQGSYTLRDDKVPTPEEEALKEELYKDLSGVISRLNEKEQLVVSLFYQEELTLTEIGDVLGLSTSRISQIHSKALFRLKTLLMKKMK
ncbi:FliA/WhiG family RNA polymerase sigma factor [Bacillus marinisedimentorum]|uniref:FliA/WhiG family RNA polymerase sigma factor n=1 Tax=Bacillus marinisedimentorum TaxID=1821260 RepID=UPI0007DFE3AF|nr:FliA/WhiG family RNA polymerase sigma factor [Bacillus marinisedimentorum]